MAGSIPGKKNQMAVSRGIVMEIKEHPNFDELKRAIQKLSKRGHPFSSVCFRCTEPRFSDQIVSGFGSQLHGARWTPKNSFPTVYLCDSVETALQEYLARARRMRLPDHKSLPMVMAAVKVRVGNLLDTTAPEIAAVINPFIEAEKIHWRSIQNRREAMSQAVGRAVKEVCFSGLIAASHALHGGKNIVIFPQKLNGSESISAPNLRPIS